VTSPVALLGLFFTFVKKITYLRQTPFRVNCFQAKTSDSLLAKKSKTPTVVVLPKYLKCNRSVNHAELGELCSL